jgi:hypothetical protein
LFDVELSSPQLKAVVWAPPCCTGIPRGRCRCRRAVPLQERRRRPPLQAGGRCGGRSGCRHGRRHPRAAGTRRKTTAGTGCTACKKTRHVVEFREKDIVYLYSLEKTALHRLYTVQPEVGFMNVRVQFR